MRPGSWVDAATEASVSQGERNERKKEGGGALKPNVLFFKCEAWPAGWGQF